MATRGVLNRQRIGKAIIASARTHAEEVGEKLSRDLSVVLPEGATAPDFTGIQRQLADYLEMRLAALVRADEAHLEELDDDQDPRLRRDEAADALYRKLIEIREAVGGVFGADRASALVGVSGRTSRDPLTLHRQAQRVLERLEGPDPEMPPMRLNGIQVDPTALAAELQPAVDELGQALVQLDLERRETEITLGVKEAARESFDAVVGGIARVLIGYDEMAGFPNYAEKIRLTLPGRGGGVPGEEDDGEDGPSPDLPESPSPGEPSPGEGSPGTPEPLPGPGPGVPPSSELRGSVEEPRDHSATTGATADAGPVDRPSSPRDFESL